MNERHAVEKQIDDAEAMLRQEAMALIAKIDPAMLDQIHAIIRRTPGAVATATVAAVLADIICALSKTEEGVGKNTLIVTEMILKVAKSGLAKKISGAPQSSGLIIH